MAVVPPASVVTLVSALEPPTAPPKVVTPLVFTVRACAPLTVEASVTLPVPAARIVSAPSVTASLKVCAPVVVTLPPLSAVEPPASVVTLVSAVVPPTAALKVVTPLLSTVRFAPPLTVPVNVTLPEPALTVRSLLRLVVLPNTTGLLVVVSVALAVPTVTASL